MAKVGIIRGTINLCDKLYGAGCSYRDVAYFILTIHKISKHDIEVKDASDEEIIEKIKTRRLDDLFE